MSDINNAMPSGFSIRPSIPERKKRGRNDTIMMNVAFRMEVRISEEAWKTTSKALFCSLAGSKRFCLNRLYTFSTSMMASSTKEPTAMAIPPKLIVLIFSPKSLRAMTVANSDIGMANSEIRVVRKLPRNRNRTMTTRMLPSSRARSTLLIEVWMKSACRKICVSN